ncbi:MAG: hypothetical protein ACLUUO_08145 [Sellimonas intestinalis]
MRLRLRLFCFGKATCDVEQRRVSAGHAARSFGENSEGDQLEIVCHQRDIREVRQAASNKQVDQQIEMRHTPCCCTVEQCKY